MDANTIITILASAVGTLFAAYSTFLLTQIASLKKDNEALDSENKSYLALFVMLSADDEESLRKVRKRAAQILKGGSGVDFD